MIGNPYMLTGYQSANNACKKLAPPVGLTPAEQQQKITGELKYAGCMRSHGITNFPDPKSDEFGFNLRGVDTNSPQYQAAQQACRSLLPGTPGDGIVMSGTAGPAQAVAAVTQEAAGTRRRRRRWAAGGAAAAEISKRTGRTWPHEG